ncbi:E3 SUMO-protein ligase NSE2 [Dendropsophus ebraccatus]|uniref:E3 SUMO-protein ligase NSE2 n=1 Tax=Dendropsophus ebraccatus TaxID=150705 RepID=UPI003831B002
MTSRRRTHYHSNNQPGAGGVARGKEKRRAGPGTAVRTGDHHNMASLSPSFISTTAVENSLSSLKDCQAYIDTGMEITTGVALDLIQNGCQVSDVDDMESAMLEYAIMNRDMKQYIDAVEETIRKIKRDPPEEIPDLKQLVHQTYDAHREKNNEEELKKTNKFFQFKEQLRDLWKQMGVSQSADQATEEEDDEDIEVTQNIPNLTCPITQVEMENPVKNKVCGHSYEKKAIERMIQNRHLKSKNARCPKIGCAVYDMSISDLIPDNALKRAIEILKKQGQSRQ